MIQVRRSDERGLADHGWLRSFHIFSFADYYDPQLMGFGPLRVINEDRVEAGRGFGAHSHRDMEIVSYVLEGALAHRDSMGNGSVLKPGDVQRMSAGTGVTHSEYNGSQTEPVHFLQIWIEPNARGIAPGYEEAHFDPAEKRGRLRLIASPDGREGSVTIHQDASVYATLLDGDDAVRFGQRPGRRTYVHVVSGSAQVNGRALEAGDALKIDGEEEVRIDGARSAEVLLFDLP
jgi:redox-sensitive bicupin YhaK (pirin superfamily)